MDDKVLACKTRRLKGEFAYKSVSGENYEYLTLCVVFRGLNYRVKSISNITLDDILVKDIDGELEIRIGDQITHGEVVDSIPDWPEKHLLKNIPYIAFKVKYVNFIDAKLKNHTSEKINIEVSAEIESLEVEDRLKITVYDGKYTIIQTNEGLKALRYGEEWRDCCGDGLILALAQEVEELRENKQKVLEHVCDMLVGSESECDDGVTNVLESIKILLED